MDDEEAPPDIDIMREWAEQEQQDRRSNASAEADCDDLAGDCSEDDPSANPEY